MFVRCIPPVRGPLMMKSNERLGHMNSLFELIATPQPTFDTRLVDVVYGKDSNVVNMFAPWPCTIPEKKPQMGRASNLNNTFCENRIIIPYFPFLRVSIYKNRKENPFCGQERNAHGTGISFCEILYSNVTMLMSPPANVTLVATRSFTLSVIQTDSC